MKINDQCIKDILLYREEKCGPSSYATFESCRMFCYNGHRYYYDELNFNLNYLKMAGYFELGFSDLEGRWTFLILSSKAHDFLRDSSKRRFGSFAFKSGADSIIGEVVALIFRFVEGHFFI